MQIEISTGNQPQVDEGFPGMVETVVTGALARFEDRITRASVHFGDDNSTAKSGENDKRCSFEVRVGGLQPIAVNNHGETLEQALDGAVEKMVKVLDRTLERLSDPKGRTPYGAEPAM